jgi:hypothetical protein
MEDRVQDSPRRLFTAKMTRSLTFEGLLTSKRKAVFMYSFIFYLIYRFFIKVSRRDIPERKALAVMTLWMCLYLLVIYAVIRYVLNQQLLVSKWVIITSVFLIALLHFIFFLPRQRHVYIYRNFKNRPDFVRNYESLTVWLYLLTPFFFLILFTLTIWRT